MNRNGVVTQYGDTAADYQTDVLADTAVDVITRRAPRPAPFFLTVAPLAPHREIIGTDNLPIRPAPRHVGLYNSLALPRPPNFNEADVSDKPSAIRNVPRLSTTAINAITTHYRRVAEALQAVDEMVERIYRAVEASGELDNTVIVFTSDNGFFHGAHRVPKGQGAGVRRGDKGAPHRKGPGFTPGLIATEPVINADLAPTFVALAGATPRRVMDGRSLLDRDPSRPLLIEAADVSAPYTAVRTTSWEWVEYPERRARAVRPDQRPLPADQPPRRSPPGRRAHPAVLPARRAPHVRRPHLPFTVTVRRATRG